MGAMPFSVFTSHPARQREASLCARAAGPVGARRLTSAALRWGTAWAGWCRSARSGPSRSGILVLAG